MGFGEVAHSLDEHAWSHARYGDKNVTVNIDSTPVR